jgi:hypothetical protein
LNKKWSIFNMNSHLNCADSQDKDLLAKFNITHILSIHDTAKPVLEVSC